jgi:myo-inositol-1(or 4)-monophosphatase
MSASSERDAELCAVALRAARQAAALTHEGWRQHPAVEHKGRIDLVTRYDRESELLLKATLARETGLAVIAEESSTAVATTDAPTWYVDPLDGTTNFVHGHPFYCVSVGLAEGGRPRLGAVVAPALGWEWTGGVALGATRNGVPCRVTQVAELEQSLLATGFPYDRATSPDNNFARFVALKKLTRGVRRCGSAAIDLCFVADGTYDGYWEKKLSPWDWAAGAAIVLGAGGRLSTLDGKTADVRGGELVATNGQIHAELVARLTAAGA